MDKMKYCIAKFCFISIAMSLILSGLLTACRLEGNIEALRKKSAENSAVNPDTSISAPDTPIVIASDGILTVNWTAVEGAESYEVFISTAQNPPAVPERTIAETTTIFTSLSNGTVYYIWVKAVNENGASGFSPRASGIPWPENEIPAAPGKPVVITGKNQLTVNWEASGGASSYEVWKGTANNSASAEKHGADVFGASATLAGLVNGTTYYVWLKAKNNAGASGFSPSANGKPLDTPGTPTINPSYKQLIVSWTAAAGADEYEVYYGTGTAPTTLATTTSGNSTTITGLTNGATYYVRLRAKNANGVSDYGPSASGVPGLSPGLYRGTEKIGNQTLIPSLSYINDNAQTGDDFYIVLGADESASPITLGYNGKTVGITLLGYDGERIITLSSNGSLFTITNGVTLTLDANITLMGRGTNTTSLVYLSFGNLIINDRAKISENTVNNGGSGVNVYNNGTVIMNGGTISGNTGGNGSINISSGGTVTMHGGIISGNTANYGGGIYIGSNGNGTFKKLPSGGGQNSGIIYGNEETGVDANGMPLKNTANGKGHAVYYSSSDRSRNTTAGQTDQIDTTTGRGLSASGNPPYGQ